MSDELKPCKCGSEDVMLRVYLEMGRNKIWHYVLCRNCKYESIPCNSDEDAIAAWNKRVTEGEE